MLECVDSPVFVFHIPLLIALACVDEHKVVNGVAKSKKKGISRKSRVQVTPCHGVRENLHCVSCDEDMLGRMGRALKCQGVQKQRQILSFSKGFWPHRDKTGRREGGESRERES